MKKNLEYYMGLGYVIEVAQIPEDDGGGFSAEIPQLGRYAFVGDGETAEEAMRNLELVKRELFESYIERGIDIPEPVREECEEYSGRFVIRMPISLHAELSRQAKKNGCSLNSYAVTLLSAAATAHGISSLIEKEVLRIEWTRFARPVEDFQWAIPRETVPAQQLQSATESTQHYRKTG